MMKPTIEPFRNAKRQRLMSSQVGSRLRRPLGTGSTSGAFVGSMFAITSPTANTPIATVTNSMPPSRLTWPKVKRDVDVKRSVPIVAIHRPTNMARSAFVSDSPASSTTIARPSAISPKYSGAENARESCARGGATSISATTPKVPATNDAIALMPSAAPARPLRASW